MAPYNPSTGEGILPPELQARIFPLDPDPNDLDSGPRVALHGGAWKLKDLKPSDYDYLFETGAFKDVAGGAPQAPAHIPGWTDEQNAPYFAWKAIYARPWGGYTYYRGPIQHGPADWAQYTRLSTVLRWQRYDSAKKAFVDIEGPPTQPGSGDPPPPIPW